MHYSEFFVGQVLQAGPVQIDEASIIEFAGRYDPQTFHVDPSGADKGRWRGLIASGWQTCGIAMRLVVDHFLKDSTSCGSPGLDYLKWPAPVRPGDRLRLQLEVIETRRSRNGRFGIVRWRWQMFNQEDALVMELIATNLFEESPQ